MTKPRRKSSCLISSTKTKTKTQTIGDESSSSSNSRSIYLPDECWERVFKFVMKDGDGNVGIISLYGEGKVNGIHHLKSISVVSKQFLSITNRLLFSLTIWNPTQFLFGRIFKRFNNLNSLDLTHFYGDLDALLIKISRFTSLNITSLNISNQSSFPANGLRVFSKKITTLTTLICSKTRPFNFTNLFLIADCFPLLQELNLSDSVDYDNYFEKSLEGFVAISFALSKLRKIDFSCHIYIDDQTLFHFFNNCKFLQEANLIGIFSITNAGIASALRLRPTFKSLSFSNTPGVTEYMIDITSHFVDSLVSFKSLTCLDLSFFKISDQLLTSIAILPLRKLFLLNCIGFSYVGIFSLLSKCQCIQHLGLYEVDFLNDQHVAEFSLFLPNLVSISLCECSMLTESALFSLASNCSSLTEIIMESTSIGKMSVENSNFGMDFVVNHQLKSLHLACNSKLTNQNIIIFASIFPNLQLLDVSRCYSISEEGIGHVLSRCRKIRHLNLDQCFKVDLRGMKIEVFKLKVLNLSDTMLDDETLYVISKNCCGLLQLSLDGCSDVTEKGVKHVVENCTQLREISLRGCYVLHGNIVASMVFSRPSLRKIAPPSRFHNSDKKKKYFLRYGCLVW